MRKQKKVHFLLLDKDKYLSDTKPEPKFKPKLKPESKPKPRPKLTNLIKVEEYQNLIFADSPLKRQYILAGWSLITDHDTHVRIHSKVRKNLDNFI